MRARFGHAQAVAERCYRFVGDPAESIAQKSLGEELTAIDDMDVKARLMHTHRCGHEQPPCPDGSTDAGECSAPQAPKY
ncbi:hypothetical protein ACFL59_08885, partial [Planctomycetota bacterium]